MDYAALAAQWAVETPEKAAVIANGRLYTYADLDSLAERYAENLRKQAGAGRGTLLIVRRRPLEQMTAFLGAEKAGFVPVLGHPDLTQQMAFELARVRGIGWVDTGFLEPAAPETRDLSRVCMGVLSSGTTGLPKLMYRTYESWADFFFEQNRIFGTGPDTVAFIEGSMSFTGNLNVWACLLASGATLVVSDGIRPRSWARAIAQYGVTCVYLVPVKLKLFLRSVTAAFPKVRTVMAGSQLLDEGTARALKHTFPRSEIFLYYGASELDYITSLTYEELLAHPGSVGRPCRGVRVFLQDGLIYVSTPYHVEGLPQPCTLGDAGHWDRDGYLIFEGRRGQIVNKGGLTISCTRVEEALLRLPAVSDAVVLAISDGQRGQDMAAFVILKEERNAAQLRQALRETLNRTRAQKEPSDSLRYVMSEVAAFCPWDDSHDGYSALLLDYRKPEKELAHRRVPGTSAYAGEILDFLKTRLDENGISRRHYARIAVLLDELFSLCCRKQEGSGELVVECGVAPDAQSVTLRISGQFHGENPLTEDEGAVYHGADYIQNHGDFISFKPGEEQDAISVVCFL